MLKELQLIGIPKNEALVYEALAKYGPCRAGILIAKLDIHRNLVYGALEALIAKSLAVKIIERGVWQFRITDPHTILSDLHRREEVARVAIEEIQRYTQLASRQIVVYEGIESYRRYWLDSIERVPQGTIDYVAGGDIEHWLQLLGDDAGRYWALCKKKEIRWHTLYFGITDQERKLLKDNPIPFEARNWTGVVPEKFLGNFNVIHDTIILHTLTPPPRIVEIRDTAIVPMFKNYFDIMWAQAEAVEA